MKMDMGGIDTAMLDTIVKGVGKNRPARKVPHSFLAKAWKLFFGSSISFDFRGWHVGIGPHGKEDQSGVYRVVFAVSFVSPELIKSRMEIYRLQREMADLRACAHDVETGYLPSDVTL